jgi:hypothetical protein
MGVAIALTIIVDQVEFIFGAFGRGRDEMIIFEKTGCENTRQALELAVETAAKKQIRHMVVASHSGKTAEELKKITPECVSVKCVTSAFVYGSNRPGKTLLTEQKREAFVRSGIKVVRTSHVLSGVERAISAKFGGAYPVEIIAHTLRMISAGTKVCVEICVMALDAGYIPAGEPIVAIGGSQEGADTVAILRPAPAAFIFDTKIDEIICKPRG